MKEQIRLYATKGGKAVTKTINNINPEATNLTLATFGTMLNDLTSNTYEKTDRITTINCDTEPGGGEKPTPTLTLTPSTMTVAEFKAKIGSNPATTLTVPTTNSDGHIYVIPNNNADYEQNLFLGLNASNAVIATMINNGSRLAAQTITVGVTETDNYAGAEVTFTLTA